MYLYNVERLMPTIALISWTLSSPPLVKLDRTIQLLLIYNGPTDTDTVITSSFKTGFGSLDDAFTFILCDDCENAEDQATGSC